MLHRLFLLSINIFFPPLAILLLTGPYTDTLINCILFLCGVIPSHIHAFYISCTYFHRKKKVRKGKYPGGRKALIYDRKVWYGGATAVEAEALRAEEQDEKRRGGGRRGGKRDSKRRGKRQDHYAPSSTSQHSSGTEHYKTTTNASAGTAQYHHGGGGGVHQLGQPVAPAHGTQVPGAHHPPPSVSSGYYIPSTQTHTPNSQRRSILGEISRR